MKRIHTYKSFKKINESTTIITEGDLMWNLNFRDIDFSSIVYSVENLLNKYKIKYTRILNDTVVHIRFKYKKISIKISIDSQGTPVIFRQSTEGIIDHQATVMDTMMELNSEILKLPQDDVNKALLIMNESNILGDFSDSFFDTNEVITNFLDKIKILYFKTPKFNIQISKRNIQLFLRKDAVGMGVSITKDNEYVDHVYDMKQLINTLMEIMGIDMNKVLLRMNEELSEENIEKNTSTSPEEKEKLRIKLNIDQYNKYKSKKAVFDRMFSNIEEEIDIPSLNKLIDDNPFLRAYSQLLYKNRDVSLIEKLIEEKEEKRKELKEKSRDINSSHIPDNYDGETESNSDSNIDINEDIDNEDIPSASDRTSEIRNEISNLTKEISELKKKLADKNTKGILSKWDNQMFKTIRDLKNGEPLIISNLSHLR